MKNILVITFILIFTVSSLAQFSDDAKNDKVQYSSGFGIQPAVSPFSLIDLSRVRWSHSYSVSYFSGGIGSGSLGLLNTSMFYDFSPKLSLTLNIGIAHNPGSLWGNGNNETSLLPGFLLDYHPSKSFRMSIGVQYLKGYGNPYIYRTPYRYEP